MPAVQERSKTEELRSTLPICVLDDETDHDAILAIRLLNDCSGGARPSPAVLFRMVRMERNAEAWNIAASKLQQDDPWTDGLIEVKN